MSEDGGFQVATYSGETFAENKKEYQKHASRSYGQATKAEKTHRDTIEKAIQSHSLFNTFLGLDVTKSNQDNLIEIFKRLPYLDVEGQVYCPGNVISYTAIGDVNTDTYPLQVKPFATGADLKKNMKDLIIEKKGGNGVQEAYDQFFIYLDRNVITPRDSKNIVIIVGDEAPYDKIKKSQAKKFALVDLASDLSTKSVVEKLKQKYEIYFVYLPYGKSNPDPNKMTKIAKAIYDYWVDLLGLDHVAILQTPERIVDVIFGIYAKETNRIDYFLKEITDRQKDDPRKVESANWSLANIHAAPEPPKPKQVLPPSGGGRRPMVPAQIFTHSNMSAD